MLLLAGLLAALATSQLAVALVNRLATALAAPEALPQMDFSRGIPPASRTLVVVPAMLTGAAQIDRLVEGLEVRFLANRDDNLHYALLTDFQDADQETLPADEALALAARDAIDALNRKYRSAERFFLFHRPRRWNPGERRWMGYERKRGKLSQLNACLRGGPMDRFSLVVGETAVLRTVKYVITLDTDTQLPRDAARRLAGAMAHPLNRQYGCLQLRASCSRGQPACHQPVALRAAVRRASPASTRTRARSPTCTRISSAKARSSARASTMSMRSSARSTGASPRTASSATICSKAATRAPAC